MSKELYEVLSLAARYLFALLGVLIVLRAFLWILSDHADRQQRLRQLPNAGMIGELVVLSGGRDLREGDLLAVPWEGVLGSVRSADICVPCASISRKHLDFTYELNRGLMIRPRSGCEAMVNGVPLNCHSRPEDAPLTHGSFLQVGQAVLRLRVFAGLDTAAGFGDDALQMPMPSPMPPMSAQPPEIPVSPVETFIPDTYPEDNYPAAPSGMSPVADFSPGDAHIPVSTALHSSALHSSALHSSALHSVPDSPVPAPDLAQERPESSAPAASRRRRQDRWEVDWSE